jgi:hypothetical protein
MGIASRPGWSNDFTCSARYSNMGSNSVGAVTRWRRIFPGFSLCWTRRRETPEDLDFAAESSR